MSLSKKEVEDIRESVRFRRKQNKVEKAIRKSGVAHPMPKKLGYGVTDKEARQLAKKTAICKCCGRRFKLWEVAPGSYGCHPGGVCDRPRCTLEAMRENL